jgi:hypothetical protein
VRQERAAEIEFSKLLDQVAAGYTKFRSSEPLDVPVTDCLDRHPIHGDDPA